MPVRIRLVLMAAAFTLPGVGCLHKPDGGFWSMKPMPTTVQSAPAGTPAPNAENIPEKQKATLCLTMAESFDRDGKDADAALYYDQARTLDPALNEKAARRLAVLYDRLDNQAKALVEFQELIKKRPKDAGLLNDLGYSHYNRGHWAEAETYLRRAVAADKTNKRAWVNLGLALAQQGKYQESIEVFQKAVSPAEAQANIGFVLVVQGKRAEAAAAYRKALELEPTLKTAQNALVRLESPTPTEPNTLPGVNP